IQWIPFKCACAVTRKVPVALVQESFTSAPGDSHIVAMGLGVAVHVRRHDRDRVIARSDRSSSFKAVIDFNSRKSSVHGHSRRLIGRASDWHDTCSTLSRLQLVEVVDGVASYKAIDRFCGAIAGPVVIVGVTL